MVNWGIMNSETKLFKSKTATKKVLIIANLFHASPRIPGLAKYLHEFGWGPIILTTPLGINPSRRFGPPEDIKDYAQIIQVENPKPVKYPKGLYFILKEFWAYPDEEKHWLYPALEKGKEIVENNNIDAIISSSSPVTCHLIAKELKDKYQIPWIADLRDLWTQNHNYGYSPIRKKLDEKLERETLSAADQLITVTPTWSKQLESLYKNKIVHSITNGFDPENLNVPQKPLTHKFTITYTGNIYKKQDPLKFLVALREVIDDKSIEPDDIDIRFYCPPNKNLKKNIKKFGLSNIVKQYGIVPRNISFEKQKESQILLLLNWEGINENGVYPLKVFEYLGAQRPILATGGFGKDVIAELLSETNSGVYAKTTKEIGNVLLKWYKEYKQNGKIEYKGINEAIKNYNYQETTKKFVEILETYQL